MVNGRLVRLGNRAMRYMLAQVAFQWIALVANIALIGGIAYLFHLVIAKSLAAHHMAIGACAALVCLTIRFAATRAAAHMSHLSARSVKDTLRRALFDKMLALGPAYAQQTSTSEVVQVAGEGVEQIETYFGLYLPQLLYALLAPLTLFAVIAPISLPVAVGLIACVPLIPLAFAALPSSA